MTREQKLAELSVDIHVKAKTLGFACIKCMGVVPALVQEIVAYTGFVAKYNPDQPRVPAGNADGGQWTSEDNGSGGILDDLIGDVTSGDGDTDSPASGPTPFQIVQEIPPIVDPELEPLPGMGGRPLPQNPDDLLDHGYEEITHPDAAAAGHRTFKNPDTGDILRFDEGEPDEPGYAGQDRYHRTNPDKNDRSNPLLDENGNPVRRGSPASHLIPREIA